MNELYFSIDSLQNLWGGASVVGTQVLVTPGTLRDETGCDIKTGRLVQTEDGKLVLNYWKQKGDENISGTIHFSSDEVIFQLPDPDTLVSTGVSGGRVPQSANF